MLAIIDRVLQCDPEDEGSILNAGSRPEDISCAKEDSVPNNKGWKFNQMCLWVSPFRNKYWESDEFFERQVRAFKSK